MPMSENWLPSRAANWLAKKIQYDRNALMHALQSLNDEKNGKNTQYLNYRVHLRQKGTKKRRIHVPIGALMEIQKRIDRQILSHFPKHPDNFGFSGGSIQNALEPHLKNDILWTCDIKDAFPSMFRERIEGIFRSRYSKSVSFLLTLLTTIPSSGSLPQGAPTSPKIFDLCMASSDREFSRIAQSWQGTYTRYADNLFFSGPADNMAEIEKEVFSWLHMAELTPHKIRARELQGKTHALGLNLIERKINNTRRFKRQIRLSIHRLNWLLEHEMRETPDFEKTLQKLRGQINFAVIDTLPQKTLDDYLQLEIKLT